LDCWPWLAVASIGRPSWLTELRLDNLSDSPNLGVQSFRNHPMCPTWFTFLEETQLYPDVQIERSKDPSWLLDRRNGRKPNCKQRVAPNCDWAGGLELPQPLSRCFRLVLNGEIESAEMGQAPIPAEPCGAMRSLRKVPRHLPWSFDAPRKWRPWAIDVHIFCWELTARLRFDFVFGLFSS
jgi:hypothetical protein